MDFSEEDASYTFLIDINSDVNKYYVGCIFLCTIPKHVPFAVYEGTDNLWRKKNILVQAFYQRYKNAACHEDYVWYHCTICNPKEPYHLSEGMKGVVL